MKDHPKRRHEDKGFGGRIKYWWGPGRGYRDIWMIIITIIVCVALETQGDTAKTAKDAAERSEQISEQNQQILKDIESGRILAVSDACMADEILADVIRIILNESLQPDEDDQNSPDRVRRARIFLNDVLQPLGGLEPLTQRQQTERCEKRVERASNEQFLP